MLKTTMQAVLRSAHLGQERSTSAYHLQAQVSGRTPISSGLMKLGVPTTVPAAGCCFVVALAMPKSPILSSPPTPTKVLQSFKSLWMIPCITRTSDICG